MSGPDHVNRPAGRLGYVVSRFPKTTETFIVREMEAVTQQGWDVTVFAIHRERDQILQPGARRFLDQLVAISDLGVGAAALAQLRWLRHRPVDLGRAWWRAVRGTARSPKFLARAIVIAWGAPALADEVRRRDLAHLHAHWGTHSALLAHLLSMLTGVRYTVTLHAHDLHVDQTMLSTKLAHATHVVTISEHNADLIRRTFPDVADRTSVVHCAVDTTSLHPRADEPAGPLPHVVTVAGIRDFKGHRYLAEALTMLRRDGIPVVWDVVGDGPLRAELEAQAPAGTVMHGAVNVDRALEAVTGASVFVMPSIELDNGRRDGIPVALIEAMALGVPVVSTTVSGIPELVRDGETGLLVPPGDPAALAAAVATLLEDEGLRRRLTGNARRLVEEEFDLAASGAAMAALFTRPSPDTTTRDQLERHEEAHTT